MTLGAYKSSRGYRRRSASIVDLASAISARVSTTKREEASAELKT
jgi:hypothetical protein